MESKKAAHFEVTFILLGTETGVKQLEKQQQGNPAWVNQLQKFNPPSTAKHKPPPNPVFLPRSPPASSEEHIHPASARKPFPAASSLLLLPGKQPSSPSAMQLVALRSLHKLNSLFLQLVSRDALQRYGVHRLHKYTTLTSIFLCNNPAGLTPSRCETHLTMSSLRTDPSGNRSLRQSRCRHNRETVGKPMPFQERRATGFS